MKNCRTPRTLSESVFTTGYSSAELLNHEALAHKWMYRLAGVTLAGAVFAYLIERFV